MSFTNFPNANPGLWNLATNNNNSHSCPGMANYTHEPCPLLEQDNRSVGRRRSAQAPSQGMDVAELPAKRAKKDRGNQETQKQNQNHNQNQTRMQYNDKMDDDGDDGEMSDDYATCEADYDGDCDTDCEIDFASAMEV